MADYVGELLVRLVGDLSQFTPELEKAKTESKNLAQAIVKDSTEIVKSIENVGKSAESIKKVGEESSYLTERIAKLKATLNTMKNEGKETTAEYQKLSKLLGDLVLVSEKTSKTEEAITASFKDLRKQLKEAKTAYQDLIAQGVDPNSKAVQDAKKAYLELDKQVNEVEKSTKVYTNSLEALRTKQKDLENAIINLTAQGVKPNDEAMKELRNKHEALAKEITNVENSTKTYERKMKDLSSTLAKTGVAFSAITALVVKLGKEAIESAMQLEVSTTRFENVYTATLPAAGKAVEELSNKYKMTHEQAIRFMADNGNVFRSMGASEEATLANAKAVSELTAKIAAFSGKNMLDVAHALDLALVGNTRNLRNYGLAIRESATLEELKRQGLDKLTGTELQLATAQVNLKLITEATAYAANNFAKNSENAAFQTQQLGAEIRQLAANTGEALLPAFKEVISSLTSVVKWVNTADDTTRKAILTFTAFAAAIGPLELAIAGVIKTISLMKATTGGPVALAIAGVMLLVGALASLNTIAKETAKNKMFADIAEQVKEAQKDFKGLNDEAERLAQKVKEISREKGVSTSDITEYLIKNKLVTDEEAEQLSKLVEQRRILEANTQSVKEAVAQNGVITERLNENLQYNKDIDQVVASVAKSEGVSELRVASILANNKNITQEQRDQLALLIQQLQKQQDMIDAMDLLERKRLIGELGVDAWNKNVDKAKKAFEDFDAKRKANPGKELDYLNDYIAKLESLGVTSLKLYDEAIKRRQQLMKQDADLKKFAEDRDAALGNYELKLKDIDDEQKAFGLSDVEVKTKQKAALESLITSLIELKNKYPDFWGKQNQASLDKAIKDWQTLNNVINSGADAEDKANQAYTARWKAIGENERNKILAAAEYNGLLNQNTELAEKLGLTTLSFDSLAIKDLQEILDLTAKFKKALSDQADATKRAQDADNARWKAAAEGYVRVQAQSEKAAYAQLYTEENIIKRGYINRKLAEAEQIHLIEEANNTLNELRIYSEDKYAEQVKILTAGITQDKINALNEVVQQEKELNEIRIQDAVKIEGERYKLAYQAYAKNQYIKELEQADLAKRFAWESTRRKLARDEEIHIAEDIQIRKEEGAKLGQEADNLRLTKQALAWQDYAKQVKTIEDNLTNQILYETNQRKRIFLQNLLEQVTELKRQGKSVEEINKVINDETLKFDALRAIHDAYDELQNKGKSATDILIANFERMRQIVKGNSRDLKELDAIIKGLKLSEIEQAFSQTLEGQIATLKAQLTYWMANATKLGVAIPSNILELLSNYPTRKYATGTEGAKPGLGWVGEKGKELVVFNGGEIVIPNEVARKIPGYADGTANHQLALDTMAILKSIPGYAGGAGEFSIDIKTPLVLDNLFKPLADGAKKTSTEVQKQIDAIVNAQANMLLSLVRQQERTTNEILKITKTEAQNQIDDVHRVYKEKRDDATLNIKDEILRANIIKKLNEAEAKDIEKIKADSAAKVTAIFQTELEKQITDVYKNADDQKKIVQDNLDTQLALLQEKFFKDMDIAGNDAKKKKEIEDKYNADVIAAKQKAADDSTKIDAKAMADIEKIKADSAAKVTAIFQTELENQIANVQKNADDQKKVVQDNLNIQLALLKDKFDKDMAAAGDDADKKKEIEDKYNADVTKLREDALNGIYTIEANATDEINKLKADSVDKVKAFYQSDLQNQVDAIEKKKQADIDFVNKSIASDEDKAKAIKAINEKAAADEIKLYADKTVSIINNIGSIVNSINNIASSSNESTGKTISSIGNLVSGIGSMLPGIAGAIGQAAGAVISAVGGIWDSIFGNEKEFKKDMLELSNTTADWNIKLIQTTLDNQLKAIETEKQAKLEELGYVNKYGEDLIQERLKIQLDAISAERKAALEAQLDKDKQLQGSLQAQLEAKKHQLDEASSVEEAAVIRREMLELQAQKDIVDNRIQSVANVVKTESEQLALEIEEKKQAIATETNEQTKALLERQLAELESKKVIADIQAKYDADEKKAQDDAKKASEEKAAIELEAAHKKADAEAQAAAQMKKWQHDKAIYDRDVAVAQANIARQKAIADLGSKNYDKKAQVNAQYDALIKTIKSIPIPAAAEGLIVKPSVGGTLVRVAEANVPEAIVPLNRLNEVLATMKTMQPVATMNEANMMHLTVMMDSKPFLEKIFPASKNGQILISARAVV